jgi:2-amino-4-hydroxy-6-hydroxymethyldihydropteridine diphosphokinase
MPLAYILLGSNLGNKQLYLQNAQLEIVHKCGIVAKASSVYETEAWGTTDAQQSYLNQVLIVDTQLEPLVLLQTLLNIELQLGRVRTEKYASRTIDIDILFYGRIVIDLPELQIPHPQIQNRLFVLTPLCEIVPNKIHPILNKSMKLLLQQCNDKLVVNKL